MPGVTYQRSSAQSRLYTSTASISTWSAFLLSEHSTFKSSKIPLTACWRERGAAFLFSHKAPASLDQAFIDALWQVILDKTPQFLWTSVVFLQEPDATPTIDNVWLIPVTQPSNLQFRVFEDTDLHIGNGFSELRFKKDSEVAIKFTADSSEIQFKKGTQPPVELFIQGEIIHPKQFGEKIVTLPLTGEHCGQFLFDFYLTPDAQLVDFDLGLKYFFEETVETNGDSEAITHREKAMRELHFPLFHKGAEKSGVFFNAAIDPTALLDTQRTYFAFTGETKRLTSLGETTVTVFDTPFTTLKGYAIRLQPNANSARLVFSQRCDDDPHAHYYFVPSGDFSMEIIPKNGQQGLVNGHAKWLTGYTGTETLLFPYSDGKVSLRFHPHQPAFASIFPVPASSHTNRLKLTDSLIARCHTAWLSIVHEDGLPMQHISQPDGGPLYKPDIEDDNTPVYDYLDTTIPLPLPVDDPDFCLPLVPHGGQLVPTRASNGAKNKRMATVQTGQTRIAAASTEITSQEVAFENQILSDTRKFRVDKLPKPAPDPTMIVQSTSPQGNLVRLQPQGNSWTELLVGEDDATNQLRFDEPPLPLQKAFQTNQQFLVITNATNIGALSSDGATTGAIFNNEMSIAGWPFMFKVGQNQRLGDYKNILIFKFCNESLVERIKNPALWTQPKDFNGAKGVDPNDLELQLISRWVQDYINDAIDNQSDNPYFQDFIKIVQNPRWNGVLALKVDVRLDGLPTALQGLIGGIDIDRFNAHHVGMEINQVENTGAGALQYKEKSSLFGLVYYQDINYHRLIQGNSAPETDRPSNFTPETFDFKVLTLMALFKNSALQRFSSKIRVTMRELFKEKVVTGTTDYIDLDGTHEKKNGRDVYTFLSDEPVQFQVNSGLYQDIEMDRAVFKTNPRAAGSRQVDSYFSFVGNLLFGIPEISDNGTTTPFDVLSFGRTEGLDEANPGLAFSNLQLDFSFSLDSPTVRTFAMQYPRVRFNLAGSPIRDASLLHQLPLELKTFKFGDKNTLPAKLGYLPVELAGIETVAVSDDWYGFECVLHMGSAGGLSNLGNLTAPVLLAWAPNSKTNQHSLFMGIKLPGVNPNAKMLSIQGLLKLSIHEIQLVSTTQGFILKINDISLKFFGLAKVPPGGSTSFYLFGNPDGAGSDLGWYAAYNKDPQS